MTSWFGQAARAGRMLLMGVAPLLCGPSLTGCDQTAEASEAAASAPAPAPQ
jgi:hypothetical protein